MKNKKEWVIPEREYTNVLYLRCHKGPTNERWVHFQQVLIILLVGLRRECLPKPQDVSRSASIRSGELVTSESICDFGVEFEVELVAEGCVYRFERQKWVSPYMRQGDGLRVELETKEACDEGPWKRLWLWNKKSKEWMWASSTRRKQER